MEIVFLKDGGSPISCCSISELEAALNFRYLPRLETQPEERILEKGLEKFGRGEVLPEHLENGERFRAQIEGAVIAEASVRFCGDKIGYGLFAEEDVEEGAFVGEYTGLVRKNNDHSLANGYLFRYPVADPIGRDYTIDAIQGNLTRFINHSFTPNLDKKYAFVAGFYHAIFIANQPIKKGAQFSFDYGANYWYVRQAPATIRPFA